MSKILKGNFYFYFKIKRAHIGPYKMKEASTTYYHGVL